MGSKALKRKAGEFFKMLRREDAYRLRKIQGELKTNKRIEGKNGRRKPSEKTGKEKTNRKGGLLGSEIETPIPLRQEGDKSKFILVKVRDFKPYLSLQFSPYHNA